MIRAMLAAVGLMSPSTAQLENVPEHKTIYPFVMSDIDGKDVSFEKFKGKVLLIVNVASRCGNTPQYEDLEKLYQKYAKRGLVILGFPANNFGGQEPGSNSEIKEFCSTKYRVTFPMFSKISVKGNNAHPLYQWLIAHAPSQEEVDWNFHKFLVGKSGDRVQRFSARTKPTSEAIEKAIEAELNRKS